MELMFVFLMSLTLQLAGSLVPPVVFIVAAGRLKGRVPAWITTTMLGSSVVMILTAVPPALVTLVPMIDPFDGMGITPVQLGMILGVTTTVERIAMIVFAVAVLALAGRMVHAATQLSRPAAG